MKTDVEKAVEVDTYVLKASGLVKDKRGYNALIQLLHTGVLMNKRLGIDDTVVLCKILNHLKFDYEFIPFGLKLKDNSKVNFYNKIMYPPKVLTSKHKHNNQTLSVGKEEGRGRHWAENVLARKDSN